MFFSLEDLWSQKDDYVSEENIELSGEDCSRFCSYGIKKCKKLQRRLSRSTSKALSRYSTLEDMVFQKICSLDEENAESLNRASVYAHNRLQGNLRRADHNKLNLSGVSFKNFERLDSIFSQEGKAHSSNFESSCRCEGVMELQRAQEDLKIELKKTEIVKDFIHERNIYLHKVLSRYPEVNLSLNPLEKLDYYFDQSIKEDLSIFSDQTRLEQKIFSTLNTAVSGQVPLEVPLGSSSKLDPSEISVSELPMKDFISKIHESLGQSINNFKEFKGLENPIPNSKEELDSDIVFPRQEGPISGDLDSLIFENRRKLETVSEERKEDWKKNPLKEKRFIDRLIYGSNLQPIRSNLLVPRGIDLSFQLGYQTLPKMSLGMGVSHSVNWSLEKLFQESRVGNISSRNSYALRSFVNWELHNSIFFQMNYEVNSIFGEYSDLILPFSQNGRNQPSILSGVKLRTPSGKRSNQSVELLYDFLHARYGRQAFVVRFGMEFLPRHSYRKN